MIQNESPRLPICCPHEFSRLSHQRNKWECTECGVTMRRVYKPDIVDGRMFPEWTPIYE